MPEKKTSRRVVGKKLTQSRSKRSKLSRELEELVGPEAYSTWIRMLKELVPWGRTHRLAVLIAGMLQFAWSCQRNSKVDNSLTRLLDESADIGMDYEEQGRLLLPLVEQLFIDAGVKWKRKNSRGEAYSITEQALDEFLRWDFMPWE